MLMKWRPFDDLFRVHRDIERFWNESSMPAVNIYEDEEKITLEAEVPGMGPEDVDISVDKNILTIKGEKTEETNKKSFWRMERSYGAFTRSFTLPSAIDVDKIIAEYDKGILTIHVAKTLSPTPKKINIKNKST